jgi:hypothetical protein
MQIKKAEVYPINLKLRQPIRMAGIPPIEQIMAIFVHLQTVKGESAWGCTVAHKDLTGDRPEDVLRLCREGAVLVPLAYNLEYSLELALHLAHSSSTMCAFDLAFRPVGWRQVSALPLVRWLP